MTTDEVRRFALSFEKLWWGKKVIGLRVILSKAKSADVESMLDCAWRTKTPKSLFSES